MEKEKEVGKRRQVIGARENEENEGCDFKEKERRERGDKIERKIREREKKEKNRGR